MAGGTGSGSGSGSGSFGSFALKGQAHGGRQPVTGATVSVYAAGNTGLGSASQLIASTTSDANGNFYFGTTAGNAITCPSTTSTTASEILYIVASGGQPTTGITNPQSIMIAPIGDCRTLENTQPFIAINEVSTVAAMAAMAHFFKPDTVNGGGSFGTTATNTLGLTNASATAFTLLNAVNATGGTMTVSGGSDSSITGATITITAEQTKAILEANVLAACVNTTGSGSVPCSTIFSNVNGTGTPALDTLQAAYYMATNPTDGGNIATVYGQAAPQAPYQPAAASVTDWTEGITYGTQSKGTTGVLPYLLQSPEYVAADGQGNIWVANYTSGAGAQATTSSVVELSPTGVPQKQVLVGSFGKPANMIVDPSGNVWIADALNGRTVEYTTAGATNTFATGAGTQTVVSNGAGDIFVANKTAGNIQKIPAGSASGTTPTILASVASTFPGMAFDTNANLWIGTGTNVTQLLASNSYATPTVAPGLSGTFESIGIDPSNNIWSGFYSTTAGALWMTPATSTSTIGSPTQAAADTAGLYEIKQVLSDSAGNIYTVNQHSTTGGIVAFNNSGALISPASGYVHTEYLSASETIDQAGNIWYGSEETNTGTFTAFITEIVGVAAPTIAPLAAQLPSTPSSAGTTKPTLLFSSLPSAFETVGTAFTYSPVVSASNPATATGTFSLTINGTTICAVAGPFAIGSTITCPVGATTLPVGNYTLAAVYSGDATYAPSTTPISLNVEPSTATITNAGMTGHANSGSTPIVGATVTLWATANNGIPVTSNPTSPVDVGAGYYNGQATLLASTTSTASGFTLPAFACSDPDQLYITVSGGEASGTVSNSAILLLAALGKCSTASALSPYVNEVTTTAAAYTLAGFTTIYNGNVHITASANNYATSTQTTGTIYHPVGLQHAFLNAANLADVTTGLAKTSLSGYPLSGSTVVPVLPTALINSVASTLAACTQTAGNCAQVLGAAVPLSTASTLPVPSTILAAALNIARNPFMNGAGNAAAFVTLGTTLNSTAPYTPGLTVSGSGTTATPHDLSAAIFYPKSIATNVYGNAETLDANDNLYLLEEVTGTTPYYFEVVGQTSAGANNYVHQFCQTATYSQTTCAEWVLGAFSLAADQLGNLWLTTAGTGTSTATTATWATTQAGLIQLNAATGAFANIPAATSTQESIYNTYSFLSSVAVDQNNNVWVGTNTTYGDIFEYAYTPTGTNTLANPAPFTTAANGPLVAYASTYAYQLQFDGQENLFSSGFSTTAAKNFLTVEPNSALTSTKYPAATTGAIAASYPSQAGTPPTSTVATTTPHIATTGSYGYGVAFDSLGNTYESSGPTTTPGGPYTSDGLNVVLRSGMTYTSNVISALPLQSTQIQGAVIGTSSTPGLINTQLIRPAFLTQDGDGAIFGGDTYLDTLVRVYGPAGTSVQAYFPCVGSVCYNFASDYVTTATGLYGAKNVVVDSTGTVTILTGTSNGGWAQVFGVGTPSFPLLQAGHPAQMP